MSVKIISINANGLNHPAKRASLWHTAIQQKAQIICAQGTHFLDGHAPMCTHRDFPKIFSVPSSTKRKGILVAIHKSIDFHLQTSVSDPNGRYLILVCSINGFTMTLAVIYAPNTHQVRVLNRLIKKI